ncbi:MAG: LamG-like jellyroll fold domain-containing protein [Candidatus Paceibacterota bacterium]
MNKKLFKAFTLIELLVVMAIIGILSALVIIGMNSTTQKATIAKAQVFSNSLRNSLMDDLVSEWKFDDASSGSSIAAVDSWNRMNDGDLVNFDFNTTDGWRTGANCLSGNCLLLDGSNDYVDCGTNTSLDFGNGTIDNPFTLSGWFKMSDMTRKGLMGKYVVSYQYLLWLTSEDKLSFSLYDGTTAYIRRYYNAPLTNYENQWINIVATYDGSESSAGMKIYLNGTRADDTTDNAGVYVAMEQLGVAFRIGTFGAGAYYVSGLIDDARIFDAAMPTSQIQQNYFAGLNKIFTKQIISTAEYQKRIAGLTSNHAKN